MQIEKAYVICAGRDWHPTKSVHVIPEVSRWVVPPSFIGGNWNFAGCGRSLFKIDWESPSTWVKLIPKNKGCLATFIRFDNGKVVVL